MPPQSPSSASSPRPSRPSGSGAETPRSRTSGLRVSKVVRRRRRRIQKPEVFSLAILLRKFCELSVMAGLLGAALSYQFLIPPQWMGRFAQMVADANSGATPEEGQTLLAKLLADFEPMLQASLPILELKSTVWLLVAGILIGVHVLAKLYESASRRPVFAPDLSPVRGWRNPWRIVPIGAGVVFMAWGLASFLPISIAGRSLNWAPTMPVEAAEALDAASPQGGLYQSTVSWIQVALGLGFLLCAEDVVRTRRYVYKLLGLLLGLGTFAALVSIAVQARLPGLYTIWIKWGPEDYRNDVGGIIGHNTAVSSFVMAPMLIAWTMLMSTRPERRGVRVALGTCLAIMGMLLIMAQSRAVVPIIAVAFATLVALLARRASLKPSLRFLAAIPLVVLALVVSQFVDHPSNPLYRRNLPLAERLRHVTFEHLHTETRLRMLVCSLPLVRDNIVGGTAWGTFHYVIPEAQGRYYEENPDSSILPTSKRSFHAHNEYLQTLVETGTVGLGLALAGAATILVGGWRSMRQSFRQRHIALQLAVFAGLVALLLHCFFDFPLRVAPLACTLAILLAIWSAGDRLWVIHTRQLAERPLGGMAAAEAGVANYSAVREVRAARRLLGRSARSTKGVNAALCAWWAGAAAGLALVVMGSAVGCQWFSSVVAGMQAQSAIDRWRDPPTRETAGMLELASKRLDTAHSLSPLNGETLFREAQMNQTLARHLVRVADSQVSPKDRSKYLELAQLSIDRGQQAIDRSMAEYYFHGSWRARAIIHYLRFASGERTSAEIGKAVEYMDRAFRMNPGDFEAGAAVAEWMERWNAGDRGRLIEVHRTMRHFFPEMHAARFQAPIGTRVYLCDYAEAYRQARLMVEVDPTDRNMLDQARTAAMAAGRVSEVPSWNSRLAEVGDPAGSVWRAFILMAEAASPSLARERMDERLEDALKVIEDVQSPDEATARSLRMMKEMIALRRATIDGDTARARAALDRVAAISEKNPELIVPAAMQYNSVFRDPAAAKSILQLRFRDPAAFVPAGAWTLLAHLAMEPYRPKIDALVEGHVRAAKEGTPPEAIADELLRGVLEEARAALRNARAATMPDDAFSRDIIQRRLADIENLLGEPNAAAAP